MSTLREVQLFELQSLKDITEFCDNNNITYILSSGNLLGAVRHGGFIPWDDDVDIDMPLSDYKKFIRIAQKGLGKKYFVQNYRTDKNYSEMWTQIRVNGTTSMPLKECRHEIHFGLHVDIFPLIGVGNDLRAQNKQRKAFALNRLLLHDTYAKAVNEPLSNKLKLIYAIPRGIRRLFCRWNEHRFMLDPRKYENCIELWYSMDKVPVQPTSLLDNLTKIKFENEYFYTYADYDYYLRNMYGDYMTPPPENERGGHSDVFGTVIYDLHKDYREYRKEILMKKVDYNEKI